MLYSYVYDAFGNILSGVTGTATTGTATTTGTGSASAFSSLTDVISGTLTFVNDILYASEQYDSVTDTYYLRARNYSPDLGRFTCEDDYLGDGRNLYTYVSNNPLRFVDPSGYCKSTVVETLQTVSEAANTVKWGLRIGKTIIGVVCLATGAGGLIGGSVAETVYETVTGEDGTLAYEIGSAVGSIAGSVATAKAYTNLQTQNAVATTPGTKSAGYYTGGGESKGGNSSVAKPNSGQGFSTKGYYPQPGERTLNGYAKNNANPEISLHTDSAGFNSNNGNIGGDFKRFGAESHGGVSPHVHQPQRNVAPNGNVYGSVGSKTTNGGVTSPSTKDIKQLYEYLNNGKYH